MKNLLMVADSEHNADMLYAVGMFVPDPFIYLRIRGRQIIVMSDLELDRARREATQCSVISLSQCQQKLRRAGRKKTGLPEVIRLLLRQYRVGKVFVPANFPLGLASDLRNLEVKVKVKPGVFFPEREQKTADEVKKISAALVMAEVGLSEGILAIKSAKVARNRRLIYRGVPLTSEKLRSIIDTAIMQANGLPANTIVAGGLQGCDPHERGHGPLRANEPIILDVFPRSQKTGYFGDITRTVVKGRASESVRKVYDAVLRGQKTAFQMVRSGASTNDIHKTVLKFFAKEGYKTGRNDGHMQGFFHGTGHGLGLDIHENPRMGPNSTGTLIAGHVVTVEPGLYYPEIGGGVRLEDVALVTANHARNLTQFEKVLEV
ncbi:MAG TPA: M24 family metallopeptidase [Verrucomicrobiae bacterium]|jgi:Xaa-Pro aminopeptidase|nr:M24 family metallopeptidase [Verrucomicrobiae bacterium]